MNEPAGSRDPFPGREREDADTARLVERFQAGDRTAFSDIYRRYFDRVYGYMCVVLRDPELAQDVTQDVFASVLAHLDRYQRREQPFRKWLFTIVRNRAIDQMRRRPAPDPLDPHDIEAAGERPAAAMHASPEALAAWVKDAELLALIERLPLTQRQVLLLRFAVDLPVGEVAAILDLSAPAVRAQQHRALRRLEERMTSLGWAPRPPEPKAMRRLRHHAPVLEARRLALGP